MSAIFEAISMMIVSVANDIGKYITNKWWRM